MKRRARLAPIALVCAALVNHSGCMPIFRNVDLTFAKIAAPITDILPSPDSATLVLAYSVAAYDGGKQAATFILEDRTAVGQVIPGAFAVAHIPAGPQTLIVGIPELGDPTHCLSVSHDFHVGKIYVVAPSPPSLLPVSPRLEHELSMLSYLELDVVAGQQEVQARKSFWDACVNGASEREALGRQIMAEFAARSPLPPGDLGVDKISVPEPP